jgi:phosphate starvation-inducible PhoH-like protein
MINSPLPEALAQQQTIDVDLDPADSSRMANLCGQFDAHLRQIEQRLNVEIHSRGSRFQLDGSADSVEAARRVLEDLYQLSEKQQIEPEHVHMSLEEHSRLDTQQRLPSAVFHTRRRDVRARGKNQLAYAQAMREQDLTFGIGPAGTGKTYLAVAASVEALETDAVRRIVLVRPAVEAGEKLGFLPGDMSQKVDPYLRPMYDALYEMLGFDRVGRLIERNIIEIAPLAFMRGRTLNESFVILDEAQNTTVEQMKMFLTRIGFGSHAVVTGDITQTDLPRGRDSGLKHVMRVLKGVAGIEFVEFGPSDVVRHPLVQRIVEAYAREDSRTRELKEREQGD